MQPGTRFLLILWMAAAPFLFQGDGLAENHRRPGAGPYFTIENHKIVEEATGPRAPYPKYTTQLINIANQNSQATRPAHVGQLSELIQEFPGSTYEEWVSWYGEKHPGAIDRAADKTFAMIEKMRGAMAEIDKPMVRRWIEELVLAKTFAGLNFQSSILKAIAGKTDTTWRLATPDEESKGIDGYIGDRPVSIKPTSYAVMQALPETIAVPIIYYEKVRGGIRVYYP